MAGVFYRETGNSYGSLLELPPIDRKAWFAVYVSKVGRQVEIFCKHWVEFWKRGPSDETHVINGTAHEAFPLDETCPSSDCKLRWFYLINEYSRTNIWYYLRVLFH